MPTEWDYMEVQVPVRSALASSTDWIKIRIDRNQHDDGISKKIEVSSNPFNSVTTIRYALPKSARVSLKIYNINGHEITRLEKYLNIADKHNIKTMFGDQNK